MTSTSASPAPLPLPSVNITIRPGTMDDIPFLDSLQKMHTKQVGWMPTKQFEGKIKAGHVLVAWATSPCSDSEDMGRLPMPREERVGYLIGNDQYFKRDDVGIIYQINVAPVKQRALIGASLLKAQFERSAYGCKLYCCWCAQDIEANRFWEAMGFVPLAFRAGSEKKSRVHIFWQKRIRAGDTMTPWWFPSKTAGGSIREDRIVLPIPPGTHWSDAKPLILPGDPQKELNHEGAKDTKADTKKDKLKKNAFVSSSRSSCLRGEEKPPIRRNGLMFDIPRQGEPLPEELPKKVAKPKPEKVNTPRVRRVCDPRLVAAARELRDRYLEHDHAQQIVPVAKYEVSRAIDATQPATPLLAA